MTLFSELDFRISSRVSFSVEAFMSSSSSSSSKDKKDTTPTRATTREGDIIIMGKSLATTGRVLLASLFLFAGAHKYHAFTNHRAPSDVQLLEQSLAPRFAEARAAMSASVSSMFPSQFDEEKIMEGLLAIDDATVAMIGTVIELLGAVLLMFNFTLGSKLLMLFTTCVTPIMHPFWRREELSAAREIDTIMFFKNVAIFGALMMHVGMSKEEAKNKEKEE